MINETCKNKKGNLIEIDFSKFKDLEHLLKFTEIDNIGINFNKKTLYAVDVAFHSFGLHYRDNAKKISKKLLKMIFAIKVYFPNMNKYEVIFSSPKVGNKEISEINCMIEVLKKFVKSEFEDVEVSVIFNQEFKEKIFDELYYSLGENNNLSDLFIRSVKLYEIIMTHCDHEDYQKFIKNKNKNKNKKNRCHDK